MSVVRRHDAIIPLKGYHPCLSQIIIKTLPAHRHTGMLVFILFKCMHMDTVLLFVIFDSDAQCCFIPTK